MNTTTLFVELLIIGIGTAFWLGLFIAGILKKKITLPGDGNRLLPLVALVYVLGIVTDRPIRDFFIPMVETKANAEVFTSEKIKRIKAIAPFIEENNLTMELEKYIRSHSDPLAAKIDYNRSRLRICRSWVLHFLLIGPVFLFWNARVKAVSRRAALAIAVVTLCLSGLTLRTTWLLARDHQRDLAESFETVVAKSGEMDRSMVFPEKKHDHK